jgi:hypothetical protein
MTILQEGARYAKFALAIYTWVLYLYVHPVTGVPRLLAHSGCGCRRRPSSDATSRLSPSLTDNLIDEEGRIIGDNICETNKAALLLTVGLEEADLVYAQLRSGFNEIPYCILLDHQWRSVVVSIRGTFSGGCVTDVLSQKAWKNLAWNSASMGRVSTAMVAFWPAREAFTVTWNDMDYWIDF